MAKYMEPKYRTILEAKENELESLKGMSANSLWKPAYHIHPQFGLINDPNGLAYFNGEFHVFYQWYPFDAMHGMKHWAYVKSSDLVNWERQPVALVPVEDYESHGAYSGASLEVDGKLYMYYTGNIKYSAEERSANQCLAIMEKDGTITKYANNPVIEGVPEGYTGHVRDPKVFEKDGRYYMLLGAQRTDQTGALIVYESENAVDWRFKGELKLALDLPNSVYMLECPDYFDVSGKDVLIVSPQGLDADGHNYHNLYNVISVIGKLDIERLTFEVETYHELDKGFDFYAPQSFAGKNNERLLFAWAGMGEVEYPTDKEKWAHCLSIPRELEVVDGKLRQKPAEELKQLRVRSESSEMEIVEGAVEIQNASDQYELELELNDLEANQFGVELFASETEGLVLAFDREKQTVSVNREKFDAAFGGDFGFVRSSELAISDLVKVRVFVDHSIAEIFINDGEVVFTTRVFPKKESKGIKVFSDDKLRGCYTKHELSQGITV
ncbi:glycosyl hydrolase family 32 [Fictibacillus phosphorivorans]|uniref:Sucrose-6-phosphate hydrolase n=1 Tax=Fictibacillus phosphorivorans TaxID=1221500 RepID=A0A160IQG8_9BACL|nr:sucrose-6-phosphate hydrolase [Fictibacillus phosphorivorans]ANC78703.1 glycosyl hydrolase family 32 [Fictibacillus phosphorivorans]